MEPTNEPEGGASETPEVTTPEVPETPETPASIPETPARPQETLEAKRARLVRELKQTEKKLGIVEPPKQVITNKSDELDYGQKAYLKASGIEPTEFDFVKGELDKSGKDIDGLLQSGYFQNELKQKRDAQANLRATPSATRLSGGDPKSKVDYWLSKGELPSDTPENKKLRQEIVDEKYIRDKNARDGM